MIGRLRGNLLEKQAPDLLLDVNGVGYELQAPMSTFYQLPPVGSEVTIYTHFVVREDAQLLYGFADKQERLLFRTLIKVNGVGPKMALAILSGIEADDFVRCVHDHDVTALTKVPGVGKKTAERLIVEMQDRLKEWQINAELPMMEASGQHTIGAVAGLQIAEAEAALTALGYKPQDAAKMLSKVKSSCDTVEELIRQALKGTVAL